MDNTEQEQMKKEKLKQVQKEYWKRAGPMLKVRRKMKIPCFFCNCEVTKESFTRHKISKKHLENMEKLYNDNI